MSAHWNLFRFRVGSWMLHRSMDVMPRCDLRDTLRFAIVSAYGYHNEEISETVSRETGKED